MRKIEFSSMDGYKQTGIFIQWISDHTNEEERSNSIYALIEMEDGRVEFAHMYDVRFVNKQD